MSYWKICRGRYIFEYDRFDSRSLNRLIGVCLSIDSRIVEDIYLQYTSAMEYGVGHSFHW